MHQNTKQRLLYLIVIFLALTLVGMLAWFFYDLSALDKSGILQAAQPTRRHEYLISSSPKPDQIQGWMTFAYVNHIFNLPAYYLSNSLNIYDKHYPNLQIDKYVKTQKLDPTKFLLLVQYTVRKYSPPLQ